MEHFIHAGLLTRKVMVTVVGAGGTGSHVINGLVQLHTAMTALGHPGGLKVTVIDDDTVSESNVGRQAFVWSDIGQPKASVLVNRLNQAFGLDWNARVARLGGGDGCKLEACDLVIGCVDNRAARAAINGSAGQTVRYAGPMYWLDMGNRQDDGQVVLGELGTTYAANGRPAPPRLPTIADLFPETVNPDLDQGDSAPSCSLAEALEKQNLFINRAMALHGLNLLWQLFRYGRIDHHGVFVNLASGRSTPLAIDPTAWERFGYRIEAASRPVAA